MINIFNLSKAINKGIIDGNNVVCKATTGVATKLGPASRKTVEAISKASPEFARKIVEKMDVSVEKLTKFYHENVEASGVDKVTAKESYDFLRGKGFVSSEVPKSKVTENVKNAGKVLDAN